MSNRQFSVEAIQTNIFQEETDLQEFIEEHLHLERLSSPSILIVTSKIVSLAQHRVLPIKNKATWVQAVQEESHLELHRKEDLVLLSMRDGAPLPFSGVDQSNSKLNTLILPPENPYQVAAKLCKALRLKLGHQKLGVIISDSSLYPFRRGTIGLALGFWGFKGVTEKRGERDLFGRELELTTINLADSLATSGNLSMGEGSESCPMALIQGPYIESIEFENFSEQETKASIQMDPKEDFFSLT